ncbi:MAG: threonine synthase [Bacteroidales bacterium]|nr:threonine synthase [Bacteroidales bacterium]
MNKPIKYYSTNLKSPAVNFRQALLNGLAPDGGLYMPSSVPHISRQRIHDYRGLEYHEIAYDILMHFIGDEIEGSKLKSLCRDAYDFEVPLEKLEDNKYIMRLDRGPTASFKDFAARMMARLMNHYASAEGLRLTILTATSGDTGSAVASAFRGSENIDVVILYPRDEVSAIQRKQMTTLSGNIHVIALDGKFDHCQDLVKKAFTDPSLSHISLSSANSINIGRLIPQSIYYFYAWSGLCENGYDKVCFSVPSGNFGNLMGGLIAREMGLPVRRFIISTNSNDEVPRFMQTGIYEPVSPSIDCISSAMNVGHPSNLARIIALYEGIMDEKGCLQKQPRMDRLKSDLSAVSISEEETRNTIAGCHKNYGVLLEPHGAVAWKGMDKYLENADQENHDRDLFIALETAHPAKFPEELIRTIGIAPALPESLASIENLPEYCVEMKNEYDVLKEFILELKK